MKHIVALIFLISSLKAVAQFNQNVGHVYLANGYGKVDSANLQTYGVRGEWLVHKNLGLNYNLEFVHRNDKVYQIHGSAGMVLGPPLILFGLISSANTWGNTNFSGWGTVVGFLLLVAPEGVSFHIPVKYRWDVSPYANFLGADFMKNNNIDKYYLRYASSFGCKVNYWNEGGFTLTAFTETRKVAGMGWSFGGGFGIGYSWQ